jgi:group II intron reverse transcriptase/maturase
LGNLRTPSGVQKLQRALHAKAKGEPGYRFYALYDKVYRSDVLTDAYEGCKANRGAAGVDGQRFEDIEAYGRERWLGELAQRLREKTYRAQAVRRVWIPKPNGKRRALGIPTITDRVVQTALLRVLEPIFEADLPAEQYGYRPGRGALEAVQEVHRLLSAGHTQVIEADVQGYFDSIPHAELMKCVARRVADKQVLHLIKMWLKAPVEEESDRGQGPPSARAQDDRGTPQGAPLSPLLSNLYMRRFVLGWKRLGLERRYSARIVNYADDLVICAKSQGAGALEAMRGMMERLKLTVNEEKTHLCSLPRECFDFLGYTFGRCYSRGTGRAYVGTRPSRGSVRRIVRALSEATDRRRTWQAAEEVVKQLNRELTGWAAYFCRGPVSPAYRAVNRHVTYRLRRWLCAKHKVQGRGYSRYPDRYLHEQLGLVHLPSRTHDLPWANA